MTCGECKHYHYDGSNCPRCLCQIPKWAKAWLEVEECGTVANAISRDLTADDCPCFVRKEGK